MQTKTIHDKEFHLYLSSDRIQKRVEELALVINQDLGSSRPLFLCVLNGAFMFASDLIKHLSFYPEISFVKVASYTGLSSTGTVKKLIGLNEDIKDRDLVIVEDIIDSGLTIQSLLKQLKGESPRSIKTASLLFKPEAFKADFAVDYIGFEIPNEFVVGYGMDYNAMGRNLPDIYHLRS